MYPEIIITLKFLIVVVIAFLLNKIVQKAITSLTDGKAVNPRMFGTQ